MSRYFFRNRKCEEPSDYIRFETLRFIINYIRNSGDFSHESLLDYLLCFLNRKQVEAFVGKVAKLAPVKEAERGGSNFKHVYRETLEYISGRSSTPAISIILDELLALCEGGLRKASGRMGGDSDFFATRLEEMKGIFKLSGDEVEVLKLLYFVRNNRHFEHMCSNAAIGVDGQVDARAAIVNTTLFTGLAESAVKKVLCRESPLRKYGLIDESFDIVHQISEFLTGLSAEPLTNKFFRKYSGQPVGLDAHVNAGQHLDVLEKIIRNCGAGERVNILLYGQPGAGKTEFCRSLGRHLSREIYEVNTFENDVRHCGGSSFRFTALRACQNSVDLDSCIIVVDEADEMLNGNSTASPFFMAPARNTEKDILNDHIDNNPGIYFWITNHYRSMDDSTRRRFDYSIEFRKFTTAQRIRIWQSCIAKHGLDAHFNADEIAELAKKYEINAGGMEVTLRNYRRMTTGMGAEETRNCKGEMIRKILAPHMRLMSGGGRKSGSTVPVSSYSLEALNVRGELPLAKSLEILKSFSVRAYAAEGAEADEVRNMNVLLYGPPGTGKTEFAKYVALETGRSLLCKKGSDLLSMWVGGTEQNIREAFAEAEAEDAILFIDEADGLFADRGGAHRNFEVTQVNELLSGMEEFSGVLVCATNFKRNMDAASIRRFNLKLEFDYLDSKGKTIFFRKYLAGLSGAELSTDEAGKLDGIGFLTPGDFKVVRQKYLFMPADDLTNTGLLDSLAAEVSCKNNVKAGKIGF